MVIYTVAQPFWAKKQDSDGIYQWLPLGQHLEDARQVSGLLWEHWLSKGQRQVIISNLSPADAGTGRCLAEFLGAVHDLAKATPAFQVKRGYTNTPDLDSFLIEELEHFGYKGLSLKDLPSASKSPHAKAGQVLLEVFGVNRDIASIIGGHHGRPLDNENEIKDQKAYDSNYFQESKGNIHELWQDQQKKILDRALELSGFASVDELPTIRQQGQVLLSGLLIMADWIASNPSYFPLLEIDQSQEIDQSERAQNGFQKWFATYPIEFETKTSEYLFRERFKFKQAREVQEKFVETIASCEEPGIFILEAPMGLGKTEAALAGAELLAAKTGRSGVFFGLPTQATSDGIFPRIEDWLEKISADYDDKVSLQLVHGKSALNPNFQNLAKQVDIDNEESLVASVQVNQWFRGRKTSNLDDFVVGTVDQFLMLALKQKHLALRHLGFSKKVVIIDEVHAYDAYMNQYLHRALEWMGTYQVPVIILSATLPAKSRWQLAHAYLKGKGINRKEVKRLKEYLLYDDYPLITYTDGKQLVQEADFKPAKKITNVVVNQIQDEELLLLLDSWMEGSGNIGIIVNTVRRAQELGKQCVERYGEDMVDILHSSFIATDRKAKEQQLMASIGKEGNRPDRHIYIGTQVMEQSLDIDFDVLVTDLAPMDLLIQRIGRLHRHDRPDRPAAHKLPCVYVLGTSPDFEFEPGSAAVYRDYLLIRTQACLPEKINLPTDISPLVQKVYDESLVFEFENNQDHYDKASTDYQQLLTRKEKGAQTYRLSPPPSKHRNIIGWLSGTNPNTSEEYGYAQVRDSDESIEVILLKRHGQGYSLFNEDEDISAAIEDAGIAKAMAQETIKLPGALSRNYNIDTTIKQLEEDYNKYLSNWDKQPWLKGQLGLILDEQGYYRLGEFILSYTKKYGLEMRKEGTDESV
ncbi:CRISPR-associated helicase Cas3 [Aerococcus urinaehominis]|uniref:CRISPR-associated helicase Cas3 n=1 Tax=Aerococcus urinaehominis TaxID=128944 RepID=A0A120IB28_9LACT|nr:CRISPR-associated helicase/endonuclease Cas3 [Aerococcus urinaehominis]AMB99969.1 CRISPR-associated helicase Cas3 [Aerococcus urinaehominis]SDM44999.1 CRISPR-associated endonuclease/helicase Cas3 [Aerococcus urinaehominis]